MPSIREIHQQQVAAAEGILGLKPSQIIQDDPTITTSTEEIMDTTVTKNDGREYPVPNKDTVYKDKYQEPKLNRHQRRAVNKMRDKAMEQQRKMKRRQNNV